MKLFIIINILINLLILSSCNINKLDKIDNRQFYQYKDLYSINNLKDEFFNKEYKTYYIYLFKLTCIYCENIKSIVLDYLDSNLDPPLYFYIIHKEFDVSIFKESSNISKEEKIKESINKSNLNDIYYLCCPSLYLIKDKSLSNIYLGSNSIKEELTKYKK